MFHIWQGATLLKWNVSFFSWKYLQAAWGWTSTPCGEHHFLEWVSQLVIRSEGSDLSDNPYWLCWLPGDSSWYLSVTFASWRFLLTCVPVTEPFQRGDNNKQMRCMFFVLPENQLVSKLKIFTSSPICKIPTSMLHLFFQNTGSPT